MGMVRQVVRYLLSEHFVLLLHRSQPSLQLFDLELAARVGVSAAHELALQGTLGGAGFLQRQLERGDTHTHTVRSQKHMHQSLQADFLLQL